MTRYAHAGRGFPLPAAALAVLAASLLGAAPAAAHPGLHHDIEQATLAIEKDPKNADLYVDRAYYERLDEKLDAAMQDLQKARQLDPKNARVAAEMGLTLSAMGRDAEAERELTRFIEGGGSAPTFVERARIRARAGKKKEAVADYGSAIALKPDVEYYMERGALQESLRDLDGAAAGYRDGFAQLGGAVTLRLALIRVETARKNYDTALALVDEEKARAPIKTDWLLRRAEVLDAAGRKAEARTEREAALAEAERVVAVNPSGIHLCSRAKVYMAMGRNADARRDLETVLQKTPRYGEARDLLAKLGAAN